MFRKCPGVRGVLRPEIILRTCPACGGDVEFFSDETEVECPSCERTLHGEASPSCVSWCEYASKCIDDLVERKLITPSRAEELMKVAGNTNTSSP
ncbi:MAG: phosphohydrolase [Methanocellales archaeon]|nr:phosphohydrolase [Methanocellales archaeon]